MVFDFSRSDCPTIVACFRRAPNINAAMKSFLKREVKKGDGAERFVKDLREALLSENEDRAVAFVERKLEPFEAHLVALGGYLHAQFVTEVAGAIVEKFADEFNASYEVRGDELALRNEKRFHEIVREVLESIQGHIEAHGLSSYFMTCVLLNAIFDRPVLVRVLDQVSR